mgnify:CR=1 FL=1
MATTAALRAFRSPMFFDGDHLHALLARPALAGLVELSCAFNASAARAVAAAGHLTRLRVLDLSYCGVDDEDATLLAACPHLSSLNVLTLSAGNIGDEGARALAASPHLGRLVRLSPKARCCV